MEKKTVAKSVRMKPSIYEFINSHDGDGFNEKFETVVKNYSLNSKKLIKENELLMSENVSLNKMIYEKTKLLNELCSLENSIKITFSKINKICEVLADGKNTEQI